METRIRGTRVRRVCLHENATNEHELRMRTRLEKEMKDELERLIGTRIEMEKEVKEEGVYHRVFSSPVGRGEGDLSYLPGWSG